MDNLKENSVTQIAELEFKDIPFIGHTYEGIIRRRESCWKTPYSVIKFMSMIMIMCIGFGIIEEMETPQFLNTLFFWLPQYSDVAGGDFAFVLVSIAVSFVVFFFIFHFVIEPVIFTYEEAFDVDVTDRYPVLESEEFLEVYGVISPEYLLKAIGQIEDNSDVEQIEDEFIEEIKRQQEQAINELKMIEEGKFFKSQSMKEGVL